MDHERNDQQRGVGWQKTVDDSRRTLKSIFSVFPQLSLQRFTKQSFSSAHWSCAAFWRRNSLVNVQPSRLLGISVVTQRPDIPLAGVELQFSE